MLINRNFIAGLLFLVFVLFSYPAQAVEFEITCSCAVNATACSVGDTKETTLKLNCTELSETQTNKAAFCETKCKLNSTQKFSCTAEIKQQCPGAASTAPGKDNRVTLKNPLGKGVTSIPAIANNIIRAALGMIGAIALLMFVYGGFLWLTSGGSPDKVKKGKDVMVWAAIGLVIVFTSAALVSFVLGAFSK